MTLQCIHLVISPVLVASTVICQVWLDEEDQVIWVGSKALLWIHRVLSVNESPFHIQTSRPQATCRTTMNSATESNSSKSVDGSINSRLDTSIEVDAYESANVAALRNDIKTTDTSILAP